MRSRWGHFIKDVFEESPRRESSAEWQALHAEHVVVIGRKEKTHRNCKVGLETCSQEAEARDGRTNRRKRQTKEDRKNPSSWERRSE